MNEIDSNLTRLALQSRPLPLYVEVFVFMALLISVIFLTAHLFLLYITNTIRSVKGKHFSSLTAALLLKYVLLLLNLALRASDIASSPSVLILPLEYAHLAASCWLCVTTDYALYLTKKRFSKTYTTRWISPGITLALGWALPALFTLLVYLCSLLLPDERCHADCHSCHSAMFYLKTALLLKSVVDLVRLKCSAENPAQVNTSETSNEAGYINYSVTFCVVFAVIWAVEVLGFYVVYSVVMVVLPVSGSIESLLVVLVTFRGKKFLTALGTGV